MLIFIENNNPNLRSYSHVQLFNFSKHKVIQTKVSRSCGGEINELLARSNYVQLLTTNKLHTVSYHQLQVTKTHTKSVKKNLPGHFLLRSQISHLEMYRI